MSLQKILIRKAMEAGRKKARKPEPWLGERFLLPREGKKSVETFLYRPENPSWIPMPVLFNAHGGGFVGCDATVLDTQSRDLAEKNGCFVVNINYTKLDVEPFPYPDEEIRDTVYYFRDHADEYGVDPSRFTLIGYSAGGNLAAGAAIMLNDEGFRLNSQILCYPMLDFATTLGALDANGEADQKELEKTSKMLNEFFFPLMPKTDPIISPVNADPKRLRGLAPCDIIVCGKDALYPHAEAYEKRLTEACVPVTIRSWDSSLHGFMEVNHEETKEDRAKSPEQEGYMREAEDYIAALLKEHWA